MCILENRLIVLGLWLFFCYSYFLFVGGGVRHAEIDGLLLFDTVQ